MWITCLQDNFSRALTVVGRAVPARATLPVTQNVLLETDQSRLKLTATNLEVAISTWIGAQVETEGAITVPARLLSEFVGSLPNEKIEIDLVDAPKGIKLRCGESFKSNFNGTDAEEFPPIPTVDSGATAKISAAKLRGAIERVALAAARDDSRPVLTGIKVEISGENLTLAAADGFRLGVDTAPLSEPVDGELGFIVPAKTMQEIQRLLSDQDEDVEITVAESGTQVLFRLSNIEVVSQLVQGSFPDYEKLIPATSGTVATVDQKAFMQATRAASIFARDGSGIIKLFIEPGEGDGPGKIRIESRAEEVGGNDSSIEAMIEGDEGRVAFDSRFLLDVLGVMPDGKVMLSTSTPSSPGVIRSEKIENYTHVVMPMFVQW
ncbi:MAG: DNA polymerase III subunit beta [Chloroflexi bacterium]|nr:DNA polymerase III subunit beta [Chloroflexota bacterium]